MSHITSPSSHSNLDVLSPVLTEEYTETPKEEQVAHSHTALVPGAQEVLDEWSLILFYTRSHSWDLSEGLACTEAFTLGLYIVLPQTTCAAHEKQVYDDQVSLVGVLP